MVLLQQAENDKLRQLIQRLTRHHFGRRSSNSTAIQLQLALEELEQTIAANHAGQDVAAEPSGEPRAELGLTATVARCRPPAALRGRHRHREQAMPLLWLRTAFDRAPR